MPVSGYRGPNFNYGGEFAARARDIDNVINNFDSWAATQRRVGVPANAVNVMRNPNAAGLLSIKQLNEATAGIDPTRRKGVGEDELPPEIQKQYNQLKQAAELRKAPVDNITKEQPGLLARVFDVLSRGAYASANSFKALVEEKKADGKGVSAKESLDILTYAIPGVNLTRGVIDAAQGKNRFDDFWRGLQGKDKVFFADVLKEAHPEMSSKSRAVLGFGLDVVSDPTTWLTGGTVAGARTTGVTGIKVAGKALGKDFIKAADVARQEEAVKLATQITSSKTYLPEQVREAVYADLQRQGTVGQTIALDISRLDFSDPEVIANTFFNPTNLVEDTRNVGRLTKKQAAGKGILKNAQIKMDAFMRAVEPGLEKSMEVQNYLDFIGAASTKGVKLDDGRTVFWTDSAQLDEMGAKAFVVEFEASQDFLSNYKKLQSRRAFLLGRKNRGVATQKEIAEWETLGRQIDTYKMFDDETGSLLSSGRARFAVDIDNEGNMVSVMNTMMRDDPAITSIKKEMKNLSRTMDRLIKKNGQGVRRTKAFKQVDDAYEQAAKRLNDMLAEGIVTRLGMESDNLMLFSKAVRKKDVGSVVKARKTLRQEVIAARSELDRLTRGAKPVKGKKGKREGVLKKDIDQARLVLKQKETRLQVVESEIAHRARNNYPDSPTPVAAEAEAWNKVRAAAQEAGDDELLRAIDNGTFKPGDRIVDTDAFKIPVGVKVDSWHKRYNSAVRANQKIDELARVSAKANAQVTARELRTNMLDIFARSTKFDTQREFRLNVGWGRAQINLMGFVTPQWVYKAMAKANSTRAINAATNTIKTHLVSSARLSDEINDIRAGYATVTQSVIESRLNLLRNVFEGKPPKVRAEIIRHLINPVPNTPHAAEIAELQNYLARVAATFDTQNIKTVSPIDIDEIESYLPHNITKAMGKKKDKVLTAEPGSVEYLIQYLNLDNIKGVDPVEVLWRVSVASEYARSKHVMIESLIEQYGIKGFVRSKEKVIEGGVKQGDFDEVFSTVLKDVESGGAGYVKDLPGVQTIANKMYGEGVAIAFDPEVAAQITKMLDMTRSINDSNELLKFFDQAQGIWKKWVTVNNPGFQFRSGLGDMMVAAYNGVFGPSGLKSYRQAVSVLKDFRTLDDLNPNILNDTSMMSNLNQFRALGGTNAGRGGRGADVVFKTKDGRAVTKEEVWTLYVEHVGKVGFASTEFEHLFPMGNFSANKIRRGGTQAQDKVIELSQVREDFFRLAHFIHILRETPSKQSLEALATQAGRTVRKFHVDYSDFTHTEKAIFGRVAPFYKWNRKALPLMLEVMLTRPGKVAVYPKISYGVSTAAGYDGSQDNGKGFKIASSDAIIPEWMRDRGFVPLMDAPGGTVMLGPNIPFNDVVSGLGYGGAMSMLSPAITVPTGMGQSANQSVAQRVAGLTPQTNFASKKITTGESPSATEWTQFITGVGIQQNTSRRQQAELKGRKRQLTQSQKDIWGRINGEPRGQAPELRGASGSGPFVTGS